jgi:hypothetical protein
MPTDSPSEDQTCCPACSRLVGIEEHHALCPETRHWWPPTVVECSCVRSRKEATYRDDYRLTS